jgi:AcrR family transcriptional regulator
MSPMVLQRKKTLVRRRQIVSAARKLIVKYGSEHVTVRRIAKEIGVSEGAIYRHFRSKREILSLLIDEIENTLIADIENHYTETSGLHALQVLGHIINSHVSSVQQRSGISFQVIAEIISFGDKKLNKKINDVIDDYIGRIREILTCGVNAGEIREDVNLEATAVLFFSTLQGLVSIWALSNYSFNLQERYVPIFDLLCQAITRR